MTTLNDHVDDGSVLGGMLNGAEVNMSCSNNTCTRKEKN